MEILYFLWQMVQHNYQGETTNSKNPLWDGNPPRGERISAEILRAIGKSFDLKNWKMTQKLGKTLGLFKDTSFAVIILNREFNLCAESRIIPYFTRFTLLNETLPRRNIRSGGKIGKSQNIRRKHKFNCIDLAGKGRNCVPHYIFAQEFVLMKSS